MIKNAKFSDSSAFRGNIDYLSGRHLNLDLLESLADNDYIHQELNVTLIGAADSGKGFIANVLGIDACQLVIQGEIPPGNESVPKLSLLFLDEFLPFPASDQAQRDPLN